MKSLTTTVEKEELKEMIIQIIENNFDDFEDVFDMAFERKKLLSKIRDLEYVINKHILKIEMFKQTEYLSGWIDEIITHLHKIGSVSLKPNQQKLEAKQYKELLYKEPIEGNEEQYLSNLYQAAKDDFENSSEYDKITKPLFELQNADFQLIAKKISRFYDVISPILASKNMLYEKLKKQVKQYFID